MLWINFKKCIVHPLQNYSSFTSMKLFLLHLWILSLFYLLESYFRDINYLYADLPLISITIILFLIALLLLFTLITLNLSSMLIIWFFSHIKFVLCFFCFGFIYNYNGIDFFFIFLIIIMVLILISVWFFCNLPFIMLVFNFILEVLFYSVNIIILFFE